LSQATEGYLYELVAQMILSTVSGITDGAQKLKTATGLLLQCMSRVVALPGSVLEQ
jgi:hypothetical protein